MGYGSIELWSRSNFFVYAYVFFTMLMLKMNEYGNETCREKFLAYQFVQLLCTIKNRIN